MPSEDVKDIVEENALSEIKKQNRLLKLEMNKKPLIFAIVDPFSKLAYQDNILTSIIYTLTRLGAAVPRDKKNNRIGPHYFSELWELKCIYFKKIFIFFYIRENY